MAFVGASDCPSAGRVMLYWMMMIKVLKLDRGMSCLRCCGILTYLRVASLLFGVGL